MKDEWAHIHFGVTALRSRIAKEPALANVVVERLLSLAEPLMQLAIGKSAPDSVSSTISSTRDPLVADALLHLETRLTKIGVGGASDVVRVFRSFATE